MLDTLVLFSALALGAERSVQSPVEVTASRREQSLADTLATVDVIDRERIERSQARDVMDLLRGLPGVDVARTGGPGSATSVFLRGTNFNHALVLIDGVRVSSVNTGAYMWESLPLGLIERIEVLRGPRAALWGSDAIGGVVQIFTRRQPGRSLALRLGSAGEAVGEASMGVGDADGGALVAVERRTLEGFSAQTPDGFSYDPDDDGYRRSAASAQAWGRFGEAAGGRVFAYGSDGDIEFDQGRSDLRQRQIAVDLDHRQGTWSQRLLLAGAREDLRTPAFAQRFETRRESLDWLHQWQGGGRGVWLFGLTAIHERGGNGLIDGPDVYRESRHHRAAQAGWSGSFGAQQWEANLRHDRVGEISGRSSGQLGWAWRFAEAWRASLNWGQGFRAPNFNELYSPGFGGFFAGNPALGPERSHALEAGLDWAPDATQELRLRAQRNRIDGLVAFTGPDFQAINIRRAAIDLVEFDWRMQFDRTTMRWTATWQDAEDADSRSPLLRRARRKFGVDAEHRIGENWLLGAQVQHVGSRVDFAGELSAYTLVDLRLRRQLGSSWSIEAALHNAFDEDYVLATGFATAPRQWSLSLRHRSD